MYGKAGEKNGMFGRNHTPEAKEKCRVAQERYFEEHGHGPGKGIKKTEEHRKKLSDLAKLKIGEKNPFFGKEHSEESKKKMSEKKKGQKCPTLHPFFVDGVRYNRIQEAVEALNIKGGTIWWRCGSKNLKFINYHFEDEVKILENGKVRIEKYEKQK